MMSFVPIDSAVGLKYMCYCTFCSIVVFFLPVMKLYHYSYFLLNERNHCAPIPRGQTTEYNSKVSGLSVATVYFVVWKLALHYVMQTEGGVSCSFVVHNLQHFLHTKPNYFDVGRPEVFGMRHPLWRCSNAEGDKKFANNLWSTAIKFSLL
jgi:hypothetical protein